MRVWTKCDRCGKYIAVNLDRGAKKNTYEISCNNKTVAVLCPKCNEYLHDWIKGRGEYGVIKVED